MRENRKLTAEQALAIRARYMPGVVGTPQLAQEYGCSRWLIRRILAGQTYKDLLPGYVEPARKPQRQVDYSQSAEERNAQRGERLKAYYAEHPEARQQRSAQQKAYFAAHPEARQRLRELQRASAGGFQPGHTVTATTRAKIGAAHKGKFVSSETRAKMSEGQRRHWADLTPEQQAEFGAKQRRRWQQPNIPAHTTEDMDELLYVLEQGWE